jgi:plasmid maintenance system antidote protein VapI
MPSTPSPVGGPADGLAAASALRAIADRLEDAEVERAMRAGWSWSQVAEALGVTRQAVHKKHLGGCSWLRFARLLVSWEVGSTVGRDFAIEAKRDSAEFIEAEHMLLALAASHDGDAARLLKEFGLDHERLAAALHEERRQTLAFVGMKATDAKVSEATELDIPPSMGTSAKVAFRRALIGSRRDRRRARLRGIDLLAGILEAEFGTVPRALAIAGIDRAALLSRARRAE